LVGVVGSTPNVRNSVLGSTPPPGDYIALLPLAGEGERLSSTGSLATSSTSSPDCPTMKFAFQSVTKDVTISYN